MRFLLNSLVALLIAAILAGALWIRDSKEDERKRLELARSEVRLIQQQVLLNVSLHNTEKTRGYPTTVHGEWFPHGLPTNPLLRGSYPWMEIAGPAQKDRQHPPQLTAATNGLARFWYNPYNGVVRARVPVGISDAESLQMYNFVNECGVGRLYD